MVDNDGSLDILANSISMVTCEKGSKVTINAYRILKRAVCKAGCTMTINAYQADMIQCDRGCVSQVRVQDGASFSQTKSWPGCQNKTEHKNFKEFCTNIGFVPTVAPTIGITTMTTENAGNYFTLYFSY